MSTSELTTTPGPIKKMKASTSADGLVFTVTDASYYAPKAHHVVLDMPKKLAFGLVTVFVVPRGQTRITAERLQDQVKSYGEDDVFQEALLQVVVINASPNENVDDTE